MATLTKAQVALMESLGLTSADLEKAQARKASSDKRSALQDVFVKHAEALSAFIADLTQVSPVSASSKEGSTWVGTSGSFPVGAYGFKVVVTDTAASDALKAEVAAAK